MNSLSCRLALAAALSAFPLPAQVTCTATVLRPVADNTIGDFNPVDGAPAALSNGRGVSLGVGWRSFGSYCGRERALLRFGVGTSNPGIPAGALIETAELVLTEACPGGTTPTFALHRLRSAWGESSSSSACGVGPAPSALFDAAWFEPFRGLGGVSGWTGGNFDPVPTATATLVGGVLRFASAQVAADVQGWLDRPETNLGWIVLPEDFPCAGGKTDGVISAVPNQFASRENTTAAIRPSLTVCHAPPAGPPHPLSAWIGPPTGIDPEFCPPVLFAATPPAIASTFTLRGEFPGMSMSVIVLMLGRTASPGFFQFVIPPTLPDPVAFNVFPDVWAGAVPGVPATPTKCGFPGTVVEMPLGIPGDTNMIGLQLNWQMIGVASSPVPRLVGTNGLYTRIGGSPW